MASRVLWFYLGMAVLTGLLWKVNLAWIKREQARDPDEETRDYLRTIGLAPEDVWTVIVALLWFVALIPVVVSLALLTWYEIEWWLHTMTPKHRKRLCPEFEENQEGGRLMDDESLVAQAWHDVTCPEGAECRDRSLHLMGQPMVNAGVLHNFLARLEDLRAAAVEAEAGR